MSFNHIKNIGVLEILAVRTLAISIKTNDHKQNMHSNLLKRSFFAFVEKMSLDNGKYS